MAFAFTGNPHSLLAVVLWLLPTGYEDALIYRDAVHCQAEVVTVDNRTVINNGLIQSGEQHCVVRLLNGQFKDQQVAAVNMLTGSLEADKLFAVGDKALALVSHQQGQITNINLIDHYRIDQEMLLAGCFVLFLILFAGLLELGGAVLCAYGAGSVEGADACLFKWF